MALDTIETVVVGDKVYRIVFIAGYDQKPDVWRIVERTVTKAGPKTFRLDAYFGGRDFQIIHTQNQIGRYTFKTKRAAVLDFIDGQTRAAESHQRQAEQCTHAARWAQSNLLEGT